MTGATPAGYAGVSTRNPGKTFMRTFACIEESDYKTRMVLVECPECSEIKRHKDQLDDLTNTLKKEGKEPDKNERVGSIWVAWSPSTAPVMCLNTTARTWSRFVTQSP